jgi:hypothetical protein
MSSDSTNATVKFGTLAPSAELNSGKGRWSQPGDTLDEAGHDRSLRRYEPDQVPRVANTQPASQPGAQGSPDRAPTLGSGPRSGRGYRGSIRV